MTDHSNAERQAALRQRERDAGIVRVLVRIPKERRAELQQITAEWRDAQKPGKQQGE